MSFLYNILVLSSCFPIHFYAMFTCFYERSTMHQSELTALSSFSHLVTKFFHVWHQLELYLSPLSLCCWKQTRLVIAFEKKKINFYRTQAVLWWQTNSHELKLKCFSPLLVWQRSLSFGCIIVSKSFLISSINKALVMIQCNFWLEALRNYSIYYFQLESLKFSLAFLSFEKVSSRKFP